MRTCHVSVLLACLLALATFVTLVFIKMAEHMAPDDSLGDLQSIPPFPADSATLFDLRNFSYLIEPPDCSDKKRLAILLVTSHLEHVEFRSVHRRGYPEFLLSNLGIRRVFLLGSVPSENAWQQGAVEDEARRFKDILQGNFIEAYRNLTYKNTMGLLWAARKCSNATFTVKMDDDIALNVFELVKLMHEELKRGPLRLAGSVITRSKPQRDPKSKWFLSEKEFAADEYPHYLSGWLYFGRTDLLARLAHVASATMPYISIDDVLLLGIAREKVLGKKSSFLELNSRITTDPILLRCCLRKPTISCHFIAGPVDLDSRLMLRFIQRAIKCSIQGACLPPPEGLVGCGIDIRGLVEEALLRNDESVTGVASAVPL